MKQRQLVSNAVRRFSLARPGMSSLGSWMRFAATVAWLLFGTFDSTLAQTSTIASKENSRNRIVLSQTLPKLDGQNLKVTIVEVTYAPGESSPSHSHPCPVVVYVFQGSVRTKVKGEPERVYKTGESFYEAPNGIHEVSANASPTMPATFVAYFVCDQDVPLSVAAPTSKERRQP